MWACYCELASAHVADLLQAGKNLFREYGMPRRIGMQRVALQPRIGQHFGEGILDKWQVLLIGDPPIKISGGK